MDDADAKVITNQYLQSLLSVDIGDIVQSKDDDYLKKSLYSWCTSNKMKQNNNKKNGGSGIKKAGRGK